MLFNHLADFYGSHGSINRWYLQPKAQVIWMGVEADDHRKANGTMVQGEGDEMCKRVWA